MNEPLFSYSSLTGAIFAPGDVLSSGGSFDNLFMFEIQHYATPEIFGKDIANLCIYAHTLEDTVTNIVRVMRGYEYYGEIIVADESHRWEYIVMDFGPAKVKLECNYRAIRQYLCPPTRGVDDPLPTDREAWCL